MTGQRDRSRRAQAEGVAGVAELDRFLEIQQVSERFQRHRAGHQARAQEDEVAVEALTRPGVHAEDGTLGVAVGDIQLDRSDDTFGPNGVEGLFALTPADRADETLVVQVDALTADGHRQGRGPVLDLQPVELQIGRIGDHRERLDAIARVGVVVVVAERDHPLALGQHRPGPFPSLEPEPQPGRDGIGVGQGRVAFDAVIPDPDLGDRLDAVLWRGRRRGLGQGRC